jgi:hypothetical protein
MDECQTTRRLRCRCATVPHEAGGVFVSHHAVTVSKRLTETLETIRKDFQRVTHSFAALTEQKASIAPKFMAALQQWKRETGRTFVAFVHELDKTVPTDRAGYRTHPSYQTALYLQQAAKRPRRTHPPRVAFRVLASLLKSLYPVWHPHEEALFLTVAKASRWSERDVLRLRKAVKSARAFPLPQTQRLVGTRPVSVREFPAKRAM